MTAQTFQRPTNQRFAIGYTHVGFDLEDFDPCAPWYVRVRRDGDDYAATAWLATEPEPAAPQLTGLPGNLHPSRLVIETWGASPTPVRSLMIDWLDVTLEETG